MNAFVLSHLDNLLYSPLNIPVMYLAVVPIPTSIHVPTDTYKQTYTHTSLQGQTSTVTSNITLIQLYVTFTQHVATHRQEESFIHMCFVNPILLPLTPPPFLLVIKLEILESSFNLLPLTHFISKSCK